MPHVGPPRLERENMKVAEFPSEYNPSSVSQPYIAESCTKRTRPSTQKQVQSDPGSLCLKVKAKRWACDRAPIAADDIPLVLYVSGVARRKQAIRRHAP